MKYYKLEGHTPVPVENIEEFITWDIGAVRTVALTEIANGIRVSTVFLGVDHNWSREGSPILFETMVFGVDNEHQRRYSTWEQAEQGHRDVIKLVTKELRDGKLSRI